MIRALHVGGIAADKTEHQAILIIHSQAVESSQAASQLLQAIGWWHTQILRGDAAIHEIQLSLDSRPKELRNPPGRFRVTPVEDIFRRLVPKGDNHSNNYTRIPCIRESVD
jgi:hypothetical protein